MDPETRKLLVDLIDALGSGCKKASPQGACPVNVNCEAQDAVTQAIVGGIQRNAAVAAQAIENQQKWSDSLWIQQQQTMFGASPLPQQPSGIQ